MITKYNNTVLYAEDEEGIRKYTVPILEKIFSKLVVAVDGEDALNLFKEHHDPFFHPIDLVITDINMPKIDGFDMVKQLKKINPELHSIFTSAMPLGPYIDDINDMSLVNHYMTKPFNIQELLTTSEKMVGKINARKEYKKQYNLTQQYKNALDNSAIVSKTDPFGIITYVNDEFCYISGYKREELLGKPDNIVRNPYVSKDTFKEMWRTIKAKMIWRHNSLPNKAKDGSTYYVNTTVIPILDENSKIAEYIYIQYDTTGLENTIKSEKKAKETQSIFLANMSHEIRTPLHGILGFVDLLKNFKSLEEQEINEYISLIDTSGKNLLHIINQILDISKIQTGKMEVESIWFDLQKELTLVFKLYEAKAREKNIDFVFRISDSFENLQFLGDSTKIKQIVTNLLSNAIKFTPQDGMVVVSIRKILKDENNIKLRITVKDTGIGISPEKHQD
ncbi:MAG: response regulator, partial [Campylobacterales bacterium]|nr:response regulator [Campylobacterales bacterium]